MKLFTKVMNGLKAVTRRVHKENASILWIKIIASFLEMFYHYPGVAPITKKQTHKHTEKSYYTEKMTAQNPIKWVK